MRLIFSLFVLCPLIWPALADETQDAAAPAARHARQTWQQRFTRANAAHDGHLTLEEARSGYPVVAKHFTDIDVEQKGYVTENDVRAWQIMRKAAHRLAQPPEDKLRPRNAYQRHYPEVRPKPLNTAARLDELAVLAEAAATSR